MTEQQAIDILNHLENELELNGYGSVGQEAIDLMTEQFNEKDRNNSFQNPVQFLRGYLRSVLDVLTSLSSQHLQADIRAINKNLTEGHKIDSVTLETLSVIEAVHGP